MAKVLFILLGVVGHWSGAACYWSLAEGLGVSTEKVLEWRSTATMPGNLCLRHTKHWQELSIRHMRNSCPFPSLSPVCLSGPTVAEGQCLSDA